MVRLKANIVWGNAVLIGVLLSCSNDESPNSIAPTNQSNIDFELSNSLFALQQVGDNVIALNPDPKSDSSAAINHALDSLAKKGGGSLLLKSGEYVVKSTIYMPPKTSLIGKGRNLTKISRGGDFGNTIEIGGRLSVDGLYVAQDNEVSGIDFVGPDARPQPSSLVLTSISHIKINGGQAVRILENGFSNLGHGVMVSGGWLHSVSQNVFTGTDWTEASVLVTTSSDQFSGVGAAQRVGLPTTISIDSNKITGSRNGIIVESMEAGFITNNFIDEVKEIGIRFSPKRISRVQNEYFSIVAGISVSGNLLGSAGDAQLKFEHNYGYAINVTVTQNNFLAEKNAGRGIVAEAYGDQPVVRSLTVTNNTFLDHPKNPIKMTGALGFNISNNLFQNFNSAAGKSTAPDSKAGIFVVGSRAGCGGISRAGVISHNEFQADNDSPRWGVYTSCLPLNAAINVSENKGSLGADLVKGDVAQVANLGVTSGYVPRVSGSIKEAFFARRASEIAQVQQIGNTQNSISVAITDVKDRANAAPIINKALQSMGKTGGTVYLEPGVYNVKQTIKVPYNVSFKGRGPTRTQLFRTTDYGHTLELMGRPTGSVIKPSEISGILFRHHRNFDSNSSVLENRVTGKSAHIMLHNAAQVNLKDNWFWHLPYGVAIEGGESITIERSAFLGVYDAKVAGLQEAIASIALLVDPKSGGVPQKISISRNHLSGKMSMKRTLDWGGGRVVTFANSEASSYGYAHNNIGPMYGVYIEGLAEGRINDNYIGGNGESGISAVPKKPVQNLLVSGNYFDGATEAQINLGYGSDYSEGINIIGNNFFAAKNCKYGILAASYGNLPAVKKLLISGNTFINHIANPIKLSGAQGFTIANNNFEDFNTLGDLVMNKKPYQLSGDYDAAVYISGNRCGHASDSGVVSANLFGGGAFLESENPNNWSIWGVFSACMAKNSELIVKSNAGKMRASIGALVAGDRKQSSDGSMKTVNAAPPLDSGSTEFLQRP